MRNRFHGANGNSYHFAYFCQRSSSTEDDEWMSKASGAEKANRPKTSILFKIHWRRVVLDEGHNIKNHKCMTSMAVCRLEAGEINIFSVFFYFDSLPLVSFLLECIYLETSPLITFSCEYSKGNILLIFS